MTILNDSFLEDLGSTNGTLVNGNPIKKHILQNNDVIEIGKYKLKYVDRYTGGQARPRPTILRRPWCCAPPMPRGRCGAPPAGGFGDTQVNPAAATTTQQPAAAVGEAARKPAEKLAGAVQILTGPSAGKELELTKNLTTLGKPGVQVAVITRRPHGYFITHVEGATFPVVNGKALDAQAHR